jgi:hypothetical protein
MTDNKPNPKCYLGDPPGHDRDDGKWVCEQHFEEGPEIYKFLLRYEKNEFLYGFEYDDDPKLTNEFISVFVEENRAKLLELWQRIRPTLIVPRSRSTGMSEPTRLPCSTLSKSRRSKGHCRSTHISHTRGGRHDL